MYEVKRFFPPRVWFHTGSGWASRPALKADTVRRELYLINFAERQEAKK